MHFSISKNTRNTRRWAGRTWYRLLRYEFCRYPYVSLPEYTPVYMFTLHFYVHQNKNVHVPYFLTIFPCILLTIVLLFCKFQNYRNPEERFLRKNLRAVTTRNVFNGYIMKVSIPENLGKAYYWLLESCKVYVKT